jgi:hypothetical protein
MSAKFDHIARVNMRVNAIVGLQDRGTLLKQADDNAATRE